MYFLSIFFESLNYRNKYSLLFKSFLKEYYFKLVRGKRRKILDLKKPNEIIISSLQSIISWKVPHKKVTRPRQDVIYIFHYRGDKIFMDEITLRKRRLFLLTCMFNALVISRRLMSLKEPTPTELSWTLDDQSLVPYPSLNYSGNDLSLKLLLKNLIDASLFVCETDVFSNNILLNSNFSVSPFVVLPLILNWFQFVFGVVLWYCDRWM